METATKYPPIPEGAPFLFENQDKPFAGDTFMERDFLALRDKYGIKTVIETGTCYGSTALWFADHFDRVLTCESHQPTYAVAMQRVGEGYPNIDVRLEPSQDEIVHMLADVIDDAQTLCFLDAHFEKYCPLLDELKAIAESGLKPVIVVHDMYVPGRPDLGYDTWNGKRFTFEWLRPHLERIYGRGKYGFKYNSEATGAKRGCLYVFPIA